MNIRVNYYNPYLDENTEGYLVEYRGEFKEQIDKVDYAYGNTITDTLAVVSVNEENIERLNTRILLSCLEQLKIGQKPLLMS